MSNFVDAIRGNEPLMLENLQEISQLTEDQKFLFYDNGKIVRERDSAWRSMRSYVMPWAEAYVIPAAKNYIVHLQGPSFSDKIENLKHYSELLLRHCKKCTYSPPQAETIVTIIQVATDKLCQLASRYQQEQKRKNVLEVEASILKMKTCVDVITDRTRAKYNNPVDQFLARVLKEINSLYFTKEERISALLSELNDYRDMERIYESGNEKLKLITEFLKTASIITTQNQKKIFCEIYLNCYTPLQRDIKFSEKLEAAIQKIREIAKQKISAAERQLLEKELIQQQEICTLAEAEQSPLTFVNVPP